MLYVYRPYVDIYKSANTLSPQDLAVTKMRVSILIKNICIKNKWMGGEVDEQCIGDPFFKYYYNSGKPYFDFLLEYYYSVHTAWLANSGDVQDFCEGYHGIFERHERNCAIEDKCSFTEQHTLIHRLHLLNFDRFFYKRHFMEMRDLELTRDQQRFFTGNKHRTINIKSEVRKIDAK